MKPWIVLPAVLFVALPPAAIASEKLATEKQCVQCHKVNEDWAGPSFHRIAQKWKGRADARTVITATIQGGSDATSGPHWGMVRMPDGAERPRVTNAEAVELADWILKQ